VAQQSREPVRALDTYTASITASRAVVGSFLEGYVPFPSITEITLQVAQLDIARFYYNEQAFKAGSSEELWTREPSLASGETLRGQTWTIAGRYFAELVCREDPSIASEVDFQSLHGTDKDDIDYGKLIFSPIVFSLYGRVPRDIPVPESIANFRTLLSSHSGESEPKWIPGYLELTAAKDEDVFSGSLGVGEFAVGRVELDW
jgi:hypothetical protein